jgi:hypothetical protein
MSKFPLVNGFWTFKHTHPKGKMQQRIIHDLKKDVDLSSGEF